MSEPVITWFGVLLIMALFQTLKVKNKGRMHNCKLTEREISEISFSFSGPKNTSEKFPS